VHCNIGTTLEYRLLNLFREDSLPTDLVERSIRCLGAIAMGLNDDELAFDAALRESVLYALCLCDRLTASTRRESYDHAHISGDPRHRLREGRRG
tara:strand:- start:150 stop:434 length:285 start_codon:yes stop_codon:yes gene_type:complete